MMHKRRVDYIYPGDIVFYDWYDTPCRALVISKTHDKHCIKFYLLDIRHGLFDQLYYELEYMNVCLQVTNEVLYKS